MHVNLKNTNLLRVINLFFICLVVFTGLYAQAETSQLCDSALINASAAVDIIELHKPVSLTTRLMLFGVSYPVKNSDGSPRKDLPLFHIKQNTHYHRWLNEARARFSARQIREYEMATVENAETKELLNHFGFKTVPASEPSQGHYFSEVPSPELFEYLKEIWNRQNPPNKQIYFKIDRATGGDSQFEMAQKWAEDARFSVSIRDESLLLDTQVQAPVRTDKNFQMNESPFEFQAPLVKVPSVNEFYLGDANSLLPHDIGQLVNGLWLDARSTQMTQAMARFYVELKDVIKAAGPTATVPVTPEINELINVEHLEPVVGIMRLYLNAMYDSQRGLHSFMHTLIWLIQRPQGLKPGVDQFPDFGPIIIKDLATHLMGMGIRSSRAQLLDGDNSHTRRAFATAKVDSGSFTLVDGLDFMINQDRIRTQHLAKALASVPGVTALFEKYLKQGAFDLLSASELEQLARDLRWRYENMGKNPPL